MISTSERDVLLVVDVQNDFMPGGALAVPAGDEILPIVNAVARRFGNVVLTQDWHPRGHISFASSHPGCQPFDRIRLPYGEQILWPEHCVQGTSGAALHDCLLCYCRGRGEGGKARQSSRQQFMRQRRSDAGTGG